MKIEKFLAYDGRVSIIFVEDKELIEYTKNLHKLSPLVTVAMGRFLTISTIMAHTEIKEKTDKITLQLNGKGIIGSIISVIRLEGKKAILKAYADNPSIAEISETGEDLKHIGNMVGSNGFLNVLKGNDYSSLGYRGLIPLVSGEIVDDFASYYNQSSQKPSFLNAETVIENGKIAYSGGYLINLMPDSTDIDKENIKSALEKNGDIETLLKSGKDLIEIVKLITGDENVKVIEQDLEAEFKCDCNKDRFADALASIDKDDLKQIIEEDGKANVVCHFCGKSYDFNKEELESLLIE